MKKGGILHGAFFCEVKEYCEIEIYRNFYSEDSRINSNEFGLFSSSFWNCDKNGQDSVGSPVQLDIERLTRVLRLPTHPDKIK